MEDNEYILATSLLQQRIKMKIREHKMYVRECFFTNIPLVRQKYARW